MSTLCLGSNSNSVGSVHKNSFKEINEQKMLSIKRATIILSLTIAVLGGMSRDTPVFACSCAEASEAEQFENAATVFSGVVKDISTDGASRSVDFQVDQFWKGGTGESITVTTGWGDADCGFDFEIGETYKVYAYGDDQLSTGICSGTMLLAEADEPQETPTVPSENINGEGRRNDTVMQIVIALVGFVVGSATTYLALKRRTK